MSFIMAQEIAV